MGEGIKYDQGKLRYDLLEYEVIEELVKVVTFGANKYGNRNWQKVDNWKERYFAALMRHIMEWRMGNLIDPETGLPHLAHAMTNLMFIRKLEINNIENWSKEEHDYYVTQIKKYYEKSKEDVPNE